MKLGTTIIAAVVVVLGVGVLGFGLLLVLAAYGSTGLVFHYIARSVVCHLVFCYQAPLSRPPLNPKP